MRFLKSHLEYSKSQRNGILVLIVLAIALQLMIVFFVKKNDVVTYNLSPVSKQIQFQLDSLSRVSHKEKWKIKPYNPNYLSDYKAYQLGMSVAEIDRLFAYRKLDKYVHSVSQFQEVTKVSDSLLSVLSVNFKFPKWITSKRNKKFAKKHLKTMVKDINKATVKELIVVKGIGEKLAQRIVKYRKLLGGFTYPSQLQEVWGISSPVLINLQNEFQVLSKPNIVKIDVNTASAYMLSKVIYINYKQAKAIVAYRNEVAEIQNLAELKTISNFPVNKFNLISLYLHAH